MRNFMRVTSSVFRGRSWCSNSLFLQRWVVKVEERVFFMSPNPIPSGTVTLETRALLRVINDRPLGSALSQTRKGFSRQRCCRLCAAFLSGHGSKRWSRRQRDPARISDRYWLYDTGGRSAGMGLQKRKTRHWRKIPLGLLDAGDLLHPT